MTTQKFAQQIEHLMLTGVIQGRQLLKLYYALKAYEQGAITEQDMRQVIDEVDPEQYWLEAD